MKRLSAMFSMALLVLIGAYLWLPDRLDRPAVRDIVEICTRVAPHLTEALATRGLTLGAPLFLRIFKEERTLEAWVDDGERHRLFRSYAICNHSGNLGPKLKEGDRQSPEGFYRVSKDALNPNSRFHLSFNLGFPNAYDRSHDRTGSFLMVHGACASIGCYAMTDPGIEEIYILVEAALEAGQNAVPVHAFPFRMTDTRLARETSNRWHGFWQELKVGYDAFLSTGQPPTITVSNGRYQIAAN